ncbi:hypothetical protein TVAG_372680 [Trichomonas vaginalis G3]|uniref:F5/8 type C domain-containing protein n=1 Tax=Trichomonas vaginalis (strain ATCC PRA-98 / G3) TaxID=412133 RepID=A2EZ11_TRIV3|nr:galactose-binding domain-like family [Trichomonas vaginalis G3]EAY02123.1 hypothetical protein TVAG_372680 [Trichomonas vaginalis G3]KAI5532732.1 galactose-binding domain-like family [Trichomonas vaginalis G3]|eukprot:XP_001330543.1 hypothetical protein [Trichomonas vaginalis G3]
MTKPEYSIYPWDKTYDWCSSCGKTYDDHQFISFSLREKKFKIHGYYIRVGCCNEGCCCEDNYYSCIDCCLYSWALQISNDNQTWQNLHIVEKEQNMRKCKDRSYDFDKEYITKYIRFEQTQPCPGYPSCLSINRIEFYGEVVSEDSTNEDVFSQNEEDDVSIIGHFSKS